jgi:drug/metabolite transporter (DMT)-like permease
MPEPFFSKVLLLLKLILDPYILSGFISAFLAPLCWMAAMLKFSLNHVYPFIGLNFVLVLLLIGFIVHETINALKVIGMIFVVAGILVSSHQG